MERRARLTARISSLAEFRQIARAMRAIAASHVQEAQGSLSSIRRYTQEIEHAIAAAAALAPGRGDQDTPSIGKEASTVIAVCSEHGLSGAYSNRILDHATTVAGDGAQLAVIGRRGRLLAEERGLSLAWGLPMATRANGVSTLCLNIVDKISGFSDVAIVFAEYKSGGRFETRARQLAPIDPRLFERRAGGERPVHYLSPDLLVAKLALEYIFAELMRAVMEGFASENAARLAIMEAADHSAEEKLERLAREQKAIRQEEVTAELLDIVVGAEAVRRAE